MDVKKSNITKLLLTNIEALDPVSVFLEDFGPRQGKIIIECYGKSWSSYWGGMGDRTIAEFFCSCDEHYIAKNLSSINSEIYDIDKIREDAEEKGIECWRDDPWNDYEFLEEMYGPDPVSWGDSLPKTSNPDYEYLCRIINAVQAGIRQSPELSEER